MKAEREQAAEQPQRDAAEVERLLRDAVPEPVPYRGDVSWQDRAACVGIDPELFFEQHVGPQVRAACLGCPVRAECLGTALTELGDTPGTWGLWGGTSHRQRQRLQRGARDSGVTRGDTKRRRTAGAVLTDQTPVACC
ncbi:MAG: WhiB family transcriptional regulator [Actinomycetota bacterium]|nr:WhiB family transcriptional regulator [Actinomycetota bacterium]